MSTEHPAVSAIIIFHDEERFLTEAVESVFAQDFDDWELLLVDDGSTDKSTEIALTWQADHPDRVRYLEHPDHQNLGMSATRNLGIAKATGTYVAFLDADDLWLPEKLSRQVSAIEGHPEVAMVFGPLLRWLRWTGEPDAADLESLMGVGRRKFGSHPLAGQVVEPPELAQRMLGDDYLIPGGVLVRRAVLDEVGGFESPFRGMYEDAVVMMKICLRHRVQVTDDVLYLYRMHPESHTHRFDSHDEIDSARRRYLDWLADHLDTEGLSSPSLSSALRKAKRSTHRRRQLGHRSLILTRAVGRVILPLPVRDRLRRLYRDRTRPTVPGS